MAENWRIEDNAADYFVQQRRRLDIADRRPVISAPQDLAGMGPGIGAEAVPVTDFNDRLATYDGYYSASRALNGPSPEVGGDDDGYDINAYVGFVSADGALGGIQEFTRLDTGAIYRRVFRRAPEDETFLTWGQWIALSAQLRPIGEVTMFYGLSSAIPSGWLLLDGALFDGGVYPELAAHLGGTVLPDLRDRFPVGASGTKPVGSVGGSPYLAQHTHEFEHRHEAGYHEHSISPASTNSVTFQEGGGANVTINYAAGGHAHGGETGGESPLGSVPAPDSTTDQNTADTDVQLPPYYGLHFIIRAVAA